MPETAGTIRTLDAPGARIHSYMSPRDSFCVHTYIVEGSTRLVVFDGQYFIPYAVEVSDYIEGLGKPVERIIVSHPHPDHWLGLEVFRGRFPEAPIYALEEVRDYIAAHGQEVADARRRIFGGRVAGTPTVPEYRLEEGRATIDAVTYEFEEQVDGEASFQLVARLPEQRALAVFDLVFPRHLHMLTVAPYFDHWIEILESIRRYEEYEHLLVGHGEPAAWIDIDASIAYLRKAGVIYNASSDADQYAERMKRAFPERREPEWIELSAVLLYSAAEA